jgi:hypothetical protein
MQFAGLRLTGDEHEELLAEGLLILCQMAEAYEPGFGGRDPAGSRFSGYAMKYLPGKLRDAWRRRHPEYCLSRRDGMSPWERRARCVSLEAFSQPDPGHQHSHGDHARSLVELVADLRAALAESFETDQELTIRVGFLLACGWAPRDVAGLLRVPVSEVSSGEPRLRRIAPRVGLTSPSAAAEAGYGKQLRLFG